MVYVKILILLYADDTVLLTESADGLQNTLNALFAVNQTPFLMSMWHEMYAWSVE
jgi:hypothetical protein